jgi:hypothetical protein
MGVRKIWSGTAGAGGVVTTMEMLGPGIELGINGAKECGGKSASKAESFDQP